MFGEGLFNGISTFMGYLMPTSSLYKNSSDIIKPLAGWEEESSYLSQVY